MFEQRMSSPRIESIRVVTAGLRVSVIGMVALAAVFVLGGSANGQEADREDAVGGLAFVDEVQVTVVNIDVFVRDRRGNAVTGLSKEDFRLLQDGRERALSHFAAYTRDVIAEVMAARADEAPTAEPSPPPGGGEGPAAETAGAAYSPAEGVQPVHVILYVDNENIRPFDRNRVLTQVRRFIDEVMQPHVKVMVISVQRSPKVVQPFTNEPRAVKDALRSLTVVYGARTDADRSRGRIIRDMQQIMDDAPTEGRRADPREAVSLQDRIRVYGEELSMELNYSINSLREVLTTLAGLPGRRVLVHISSGLPAVPARDLINWYGELYQKSSTLPMLARFNRRYVYESVASSANAQGVTFYTIDASGLGGGGSASAEHARPIDPLTASIHTLNYQEPLLFLAERTGGRAIVDSNDVTSLLEEMRDDLFTYYSLGYTLSASGSDTVHRIEVELPAHPEYELVYRRTLVEKSLETRVQERVVSGLMLALDDNPMAIAISAGAPTTAAASDRWILPVEVAIPIESVALLPEAGEYVGRVVLFIANRDLNGRQSDIQRRQFEIRMPPEDYASRRNQHYVAALDLLLNSGDHKVVVGVLDPVTRQASFASIRQSVKGAN
jgi:VWFA-related protein